MNFRSRIFSLVIGLLFALPSAARLSVADDTESPSPSLSNPQQLLLADIGITQKLNETIPLDLNFTDSKGKPVELGDVFTDRPVVLALVYHECPKLCNQVLHGLMTSLRAIDYSAGEEYDVLIVSFDPRETPQLAAERKNGFARLYDRAGSEAGFHFLTGDEENIRALADAVGFNYRWDDNSAQYAHASGIMVLTPEGTLSKYYYGIDYNTRDLRFGIIQASQGKVGSFADAILLLCFHYDPTTGKYGLVISRIIQAGGVLTVVCLAAFVFISLRTDRRDKRAANLSDSLNSPS